MLQESSTLSWICLQGTPARLTGSLHSPAPGLCSLLPGLPLPQLCPSKLYLCSCPWSPESFSTPQSIVNQTSVGALPRMTHTRPLPSAIPTWAGKRLKGKDKTGALITASGPHPPPHTHTHSQSALQLLGGSLPPPGRLLRSPQKSDFWGPLCGSLTFHQILPAQWLPEPHPPLKDRSWGMQPWVPHSPNPSPPQHQTPRLQQCC